MRISDWSSDVCSSDLTNPFKLETPAMQLDRAVDAPRAQGGTAVHYRPPRKTDGTRIWALIRSIAALDDNSLYCNLLQCSHFAGTCALAEIDGQIGRASCRERVCQYV